MIKKLIIVLAVIAVLAGCAGAGVADMANVLDIQGSWDLVQVSCVPCCSDTLTYDFRGDYSYLYYSGSVSCGLNNSEFDYSFDTSENIITIDGAESANTGLVDGDYYVYISDDEDTMVWDFADFDSIHAYVFSK